MGRRSLSDGHFSHDQQVRDVMNRLEPADWAKFEQAWPDLADGGITWEGSHWDCVGMGIDEETPQWVADWLEAETDVFWEDGEPWMPDGKEDDLDDEDGAEG